MNRREFLKKGLFSSIIALPLVVFSKQQFAFNDNKKTITKKEFEEIKNNNVNKNSDTKLSQQQQSIACVTAQDGARIISLSDINGVSYVELNKDIVFVK